MASAQPRPKWDLVREDTIADLAVPAAAPQALGKYRIIKRLAIGGMSELFLARVIGAEGFERHVVVKRMLTRLATSSNFVEMFLDEARLTARLHHPNIVQVYDLGQHDGAYFLAMEYLHGPNLQTILRAAKQAKQLFPVKHALTIVTSVATALAYAHDKKDKRGAPLHIVHRDVAPSNIIVTYDGGVKLLDFGIARAHSNSNHTDAGLIKGKLSYLSPEQCLGNPIDRRSDVFSLGIVLYELTTMSQLFPLGNNDKLDILERIANGDILPPSRRMHPYPRELEAIVMRALHVDPDQRYQTAGELLEALEVFARSKGYTLSATELGRYVDTLVGRKPEPWQAQGSVSSGLDDSTSVELPSAHDADALRGMPTEPGDSERALHKATSALEQLAGAAPAPADAVAMPSSAVAILPGAATAPTPSPAVPLPAPSARIKTERTLKLSRVRGRGRAIGWTASLLGVCVAALLGYNFYYQAWPDPWQWIAAGSLEPSSPADRAQPLASEPGTVATPAQQAETTTAGAANEPASDAGVDSARARGTSPLAPAASTPADARAAAASSIIDRGEGQARAKREQKRSRSSRTDRQAARRQSRAKARKRAQKQRSSEQKRWAVDDLFPPSVDE